MSGQKKSILLIDDENESFQFITKSLQENGYDVIKTASGENTKEILGGPGKINLILLTINQDIGLKWTESVREILSEHDIPVIFLLDRFQDNIFESTAGLYCYGYVMKENADAVLLSTINAALNFSEIRMNKYLSNEINAKKALEGKEVLLKELQHRVKNSLSIINAMIGMELNSQTFPSTQVILKDLRSRINSLAKLYDLLYQSQEIAQIQLKEYIENLCRSTIDVYTSERGLIDLNFDLDEISIDISKAIHLGLILNELLINSLKFAFTQGQKGNIKIFLKKIDPIITLIVSDNGKGLPEGMTNLENHHGLGLEIISLITSHLGGNIKYNYSNGSEFRIEIPSI